ncbi:hypothetical protein K456DRAFT_40919 [Colletotrichum gloeosporioides 23]|nr:hypothetical protein K456DRAFT_40919 [Colletotrichum gloeosporioides 23]
MFVIARPTDRKKIQENQNNPPDVRLHEIKTHKSLACTRSNPEHHDTTSYECAKVHLDVDGKSVVAPACEKKIEGTSGTQHCLRHATAGYLSAQKVAPRPVSHGKTFGDQNDESGQDPRKSCNVEWVNSGDTLANEQTSQNTTHNENATRGHCHYDVHTTCYNNRFLLYRPSLSIGALWFRFDFASRFLSQWINQTWIPPPTPN